MYYENVNICIGRKITFLILLSICIIRIERRC